MKEYFSRYPIVKDIVAVAIFAIFVAVGTIFVNAFLFRSYTVQGPSMEPTFHTDDRVLVNRLAVTIDQLQNKRFKPQRGQVIVFRNPRYDSVNDRVEYIVKRVIAFEGERVTVKDGVLTVYNAEHPEGFHPDETFPDKPGSPSSGNSDVTVGKDMIYVQVTTAKTIIRTIHAMGLDKCHSSTSWVLSSCEFCHSPVYVASNHTTTYKKTPASYVRGVILLVVIN